MNICLGCGYEFDGYAEEYYCINCSKYIEIDKIESRSRKVEAKVKKMKRDKPVNKKFKNYDRTSTKYDEIY